MNWILVQRNKAYSIELVQGEVRPRLVTKTKNPTAWTDLSVTKSQKEKDGFNDPEQFAWSIESKETN